MVTNKQQEVLNCLSTEEVCHELLERFRNTGGIDSLYIEDMKELIQHIVDTDRVTIEWNFV